MAGASKEAGIKLTLTSQGFSKGLKGAEDEAKKAGKDMGEALKGALSDGLKGGLDTLKSTVSNIKSTILSIGGIAGGIGIAELIRGAITTEGTFRKVAFAIRAGTGEMVRFRDLQREAQQAALKTGQATDDLGKIMHAVFAETGDADFARNTIETIGTAATGAHEPIETMGNLAGTLNEKFGITEETLGAALAQIIGLGNKGGVSVGELADKLGFVGAYAREAGLQGEDGLGTIIGLLNVADDSGKNFQKNIVAVGGLMEQLGAGAKRNKLLSTLGIDAKKAGTDVTSVIGEILKKTGGQREKLAMAFQGDQLQFLVDLGKTYAEAFQNTQGDVKAKTAAALDAYRSSLAEASKTTLSWEDVQKEAAAEMETTDKKFQVALEKLKQAFSKPEITSAIERLAASLPGLADVVEKVMGFAVKNPLAAGGIAAAGVFGKGALESGASSLFSAITGAMSKGGAEAGGSIAKAMAGSASGFASSLAPLMGPIGLALGASIGIMLLASLKDAEDEKKRREAQARDAEKMIKGQAGAPAGKYQIAGAVEAATGIEQDPTALLTDAEIAAMSANQDQRDALELARAQARAKVGSGRDLPMLKGAAAERLLAAGGTVYNDKGQPIDPNTGKVITSSEGPSAPTSWVDPMMGGVSGVHGQGTPVTGPPPAVATRPVVTAPQQPAFDPQIFASALSRQKLLVEITNPEAIRAGGSGPSTGSPTPGNVPRK